MLKVGLVLLAASACHNAAGYALGYAVARMLGLGARDRRTMALEVGLQNGGMATGLAFNVLQSPAAALAAATFGPWSAVTSSVLAPWWRRGGAVVAPLPNGDSLMLTRESDFQRLSGNRGKSFSSERVYFGIPS